MKQEVTHLKASFLPNGGDGAFYLPLSQGKFAIVDASDAHLGAWKWCAAKCQKTGTFYVQKTQLIENGKHIAVKLHHAVIGRGLNGLVVDHINGNPLDNRRSNLRLVTRRVNNSNTTRRRNGVTASRYVGVFWDRKAWRAKIKINRKVVYLGSFRSEQEAGIAYENKVREIGFL